MVFPLILGRAALCRRLAFCLFQRQKAIGPVNTIRCLLGGREPPRSAVDARKASAAPNGHGPAGRLSVDPFPPSPPSLPQRAFIGEEAGTRGNPTPKSKWSMYCFLFYLLKLFVKFVLTGPNPETTKQAAAFGRSLSPVRFTTGREIGSAYRKSGSTAARPAPVMIRMKCR